MPPRFADPMLDLKIYNVESAKETRVDRTIASRDSRPSENQIGGIGALLSLGYRAIAITRVLDATDWARTENLTAAKSAGFADGENVDHLTKETIVLPAIHLGQGKGDHCSFLGR